MKTQQIALFAALAIGGFAAYKYFTTPTPPPGYANANYIPAGGVYNGYANTTGQPVWISALNGTASIVTALGTVLQTIPWNSSSNNSPFYEDPNSDQPSAF